jgi:hypothetical protein
MASVYLSLQSETRGEGMDVLVWMQWIVVRDWADFEDGTVNVSDEHGMRLCTCSLTTQEIFREFLAHSLIFIHEISHAWYLTVVLQILRPRRQNHPNVNVLRVDGPRLEWGSQR